MKRELLGGFYNGVKDSGALSAVAIPESRVDSAPNPSLLRKEGNSFFFTLFAEQRGSTSGSNVGMSQLCERAFAVFFEVRPTGEGLGKAAA
jgi:hypothetical protein